MSDDIYYMIMDNDTEGLNNVSLSKLNSKFNGSTYLNEAIEIGNPKIIKILLDKGVNIDTKDDFDESPMDIINKILKKKKCYEYINIKKMIDNEKQLRINKSKSQISSLKKVSELDYDLIQDINKRISKKKSPKTSKKKSPKTSKKKSSIPPKKSKRRYRKNAKYYK